MHVSIQPNGMSCSCNFLFFLWRTFYSRGISYSCVKKWKFNKFIQPSHLTEQVCKSNFCQTHTFLTKNHSECSCLLCFSKNKSLSWFKSIIKAPLTDYPLDLSRECVKDSIFTVDFKGTISLKASSYEWVVSVCHVALYQ